MPGVRKALSGARLRHPQPRSTNKGSRRGIREEFVARHRNPASPSTNCGWRVVRQIPSHRTAHRRSLRETPGGSAVMRRWIGWICQNGIDRTHHIGDRKVTFVARKRTPPIANSRQPFANARSPFGNATTATANSTAPFVNAQSADVNPRHRYEFASLNWALNNDVCEFAATHRAFNITDCERTITRLECISGRLPLRPRRVLPTKTIRIRRQIRATKEPGCNETTSMQGEHNGKISKARS